VQDRISNGVPVTGLAISRGYDTKFESALKITDKIGHVNVEDLGFSIAPSKKAHESSEPKQKDSLKDVPKLRIKSASSKKRVHGSKKEMPSLTKQNTKRLFLAMIGLSKTIPRTNGD
jgi:hypothetical protein